MAASGAWAKNDNAFAPWVRMKICEYIKGEFSLRGWLSNMRTLLPHVLLRAQDSQPKTREKDTKNPVNSRSSLVFIFTKGKMFYFGFSIFETYTRVVSTRWKNKIRESAS